MLKSIFKYISNLLATKNLYLTKSLNYKNKSGLLPINLDYVRYATLTLCQEEITAKGIGGNIAEVGVFRGDFAKRLNVLFPDKKLYLFDTFEGFSKDDVQFEKNNKYSSGAQDFSGTNIELVRSKMKYPENCIFKKGRFPETAADLEDQFCFVSLDADLFLPIYSGLEYFYPRLSKGGYIFIHDFNNSGYSGARDAVIKFCNENNIGFVPIADSGGTAIISK
ncbi:MAG TPA: TylF/MycF/NovP-related O-methyltransferase [Edaphocola sp.]|nr:TylF/MycF/NovP-related O-methyltransferase [Edaphocola sp.]